MDKLTALRNEKSTLKVRLRAHDTKFAATHGRPVSG